MPLFRLSNALVLFVHIPKTAGTSVEAMLKLAGGTEALRHPEQIVGLPCTPQHFHAAILARLIPRDLCEYEFTIVRNPYDRLASEYRMRGIAAPFDQWVDQVFAQYANDPFIVDNHIRPQSDFLFEGLEVFHFEDQAVTRVRERLQSLGLIGPVETPWLRKGPVLPISAPRETVRRIADFYSADFERLGYSPDRHVGLI